MPYPLLTPELLRIRSTDFVLGASSGPEGSVRILQIGEGNFLRGFFNWMIHETRRQGLYEGTVAVTQPRKSGAANLEALRRQGGMYSLVIRGLEDGRRVERSEVIHVFSRLIDPFEAWTEFLRLAEGPDLEVVVSNTTEAGLVYRRTDFDTEGCPESFPARLTLFLYRRFLHFEGAAERGLVLLPCELVEQNGHLLQTIVFQHAADWGLTGTFTDWLKRHNRFCNNLVDRIVSGFPSADAAQWETRLGYSDTLLNIAEPYHLWVIEADESLERVLPLRAAGLNVHYVNDLAPWQLRKVRILNAAHTLMVSMGRLRSFVHVREVMTDRTLSDQISAALYNEILPSLSIDQLDAQNYVTTVFERFRNPFMNHRLADISLNSIAKFRTRVLPSMMEYRKRQGQLAPTLVQAWAELIRLYQVRLPECGNSDFWSTTLVGERLVIRDEADVLEIFHKVWMSVERGECSLRTLTHQLLQSRHLWGDDFSGVPGLGQALYDHLIELEGVR